MAQVTDLSLCIECVFTTITRLFHFRYGPADSEPNLSPFDRRLDTSVVKVDVRDGEQFTDLISCLSRQLSHEILSRQQVIFEPSDVVTFQIVRHEPLPSYSGASPSRQPFRYPKCLYLDQFMYENADLANQKRNEQREIQEHIERLRLRKVTLTLPNVRPFMQLLKFRW